MQLAGRTVVITGGSSGLGKAMAAALVKKRANVVVSSNQPHELQGVARECGVIAIPADVTDEDAIKRLAEETIKQFGSIDVWINNAGIWMPHAGIEAMDMAKLHKVMEVNVFGPIYGSRAALRQMRKQKGGIIVNIISVSALEGRPFSSGYCASKFAADGFSKSLRLEVARDGIDVISIYPDRMKTDLFNESRPEDFNAYMAPDTVAARIVKNLEAEHPEQELVVD